MKEMPKLGTVDSPFFRTGLGVPTYAGYSPSILHPSGIPGTPFAPPNHLTPFAPKVIIVFFFYKSSQMRLKSLSVSCFFAFSKESRF